MKYFAFVALFLVLAIQAYAQPTPASAAAAAAADAAPKTEENQPSQSEAQVYDEAHVGAAKDKRAVIFYTTSAIVPPFPTLYRYSYVPLYPALPPPTVFL